MRYETEYVIVAGVAWIRRSRVETSAGRAEDSVWVVTFDGETLAHKGDAGDSTPTRGRLGDVQWELSWTTIAPAFETPHRLLRRIAPTRLISSSAILVDGHVGGRRLEGAPGHTARLSGRRHARSWGWAHASAADGRWAHLLTASAPPLPRVSQHATHEGSPGLPLARGGVEGTRVTVGSYSVEAPPESFVGPGVDFDGAAMEIAVREPIEGWTVAA